MPELSDRQRDLCTTAPARYDDLRAVLVTCTLKPSPRDSHTDTRLDGVAHIFEANSLAVDRIRFVDHDNETAAWPLAAS